MRRRLVITVVATSLLILIALLLPMAALVQRFAVEDALAAASLEVQATESVVSFRERADLVSFIQDINDGEPDRRTTVLFADGDAIGPDSTITPDVVRARETGQAISSNTDSGGVEVLVPVTVRGQAGDQEDSEPVAAEVSVIRVVIVAEAISRDILLSWAVLAALGVGLLVLAVLVADRLGRTLVRPVVALARTAERLGHGELTARAVPDGPPEISDVGLALNTLATRIQELLEAERESVADASHRLRTPITALRLEAGELRDAGERARLTAAVDSMGRAVDALIRDARRPVRDDLGASTDLVSIVAERTRFWRALAEDQDRAMDLRLPPAPVLVKVSDQDMAACVDILLDNLFSHTAERVPFRVTVMPDEAGGAVLVIADGGPGFPDLDHVVDRGASTGGSSGLGLDIVRRTAEASGGLLTLENPPSGGARVVVRFGPSAGDAHPGPSLAVLMPRP